MSELTRDMQIVADAIGEANARLLMKKCAGTNVYIPKGVEDEDVVAELKRCYYDAKIVARNLGVSMSRVYKVLKELRDKK